MLKHMNGDLIELAMGGEFDLIVHACNCYHDMSTGIGLEIKRNFPGAYEIDKLTPLGVPWKLGKTSSEVCSNRTTGVRVVNAYTHFLPGREKPEDLYRNIEECFSQIVHLHQGDKIGIPKIGCGFAGGNWFDIKPIIERVMGNSDITVVHFY